MYVLKQLLTQSTRSANSSTCKIGRTANRFSGLVSLLQLTPHSESTKSTSSLTCKRRRTANQSSRVVFSFFPQIRRVNRCRYFSLVHQTLYSETNKTSHSEPIFRLVSFTNPMKTNEFTIIPI